MTNLVYKGTNDQAVTTSLMVAKQFEKGHNHILRDIENLIGGLSNFGYTHIFEKSTYVNPQNGQTYPMYIMNRDGFTLLAMSFTGEKAMQFKLAYINAFNQMEQKIKQEQSNIPQSFSQALLLAAQQQEQIEKQQKLLTEQKEAINTMQPKAVFADAVTGSKGDITVREFAKILSNKFTNIGQNRLFDWFVEHKYLMNNNSHEPYQRYVDLGLFSRTEHPVDINGVIHNKFTTKITPKGQAYFVGKYSQQQPQQLQLDYSDSDT